VEKVQNARKSPRIVREKCGEKEPWSRQRAFKESGSSTNKGMLTKPSKFTR
jgi:hypothetical protein